jgi:hypothetical protein
MGRGKWGRADSGALRILAWVLGVLVSASAVSSGGRSKAPVTSIAGSDLAALGADVLILDARPWYAFRVLHIDGAIEVSSATVRRSDVEGWLEGSRARAVIILTPENGGARERELCSALSAWTDLPLRAYREDIEVWALARPERTRYFGELLDARTAAAAVIDEDEQRAVRLAPKAFLELAARGGSRVYDLRSEAGPERDPLRAPDLVRLPLEKAIDYLERGSGLAGERVLFVDDDGSETRWLHYWLVRAGRRDFAFLDGGISGRDRRSSTSASESAALRVPSPARTPASPEHPKPSRPEQVAPTRPVGNEVDPSTAPSGAV